MIKLLAVDMDGTCLDGRSRMSGENLAALRRAAQAGILVVPTTGRSLSCLPYRLRSEKFFRYVISSNGAQVTDLHTGESLFQALIPKRRAMRLVQLAQSLPVSITAHVEQKYLVRGRAFWLMGRVVFGPDAAASICVGNMNRVLRQQAADVEELQFYFFTGRTGRKLRCMLERYAPDCRWAFTDQYVEIFSNNASKGAALAALAARLNIPKEQIACIGDGENDLPMFEAAGLRIAMGNAVPQLKEKASQVSRSNRHNGVAYAIDRWILQEQ